MNEIIEKLQPYWLGILIGFIIGLERERAHQFREQPFGVRTFSLIGFLGSFAASGISETLAALTALFVLAAILLGYWRSTDEKTDDVGFTTEVSAFCVFALGSISVKEPLVACILGAFVLALLAGRVWIHNFTRQRITKQEADAFITLIVLGAGILPLLPKEPLDPWGAFVPFSLGSLVFALALIQFLSYLLLKFFGAQAGRALGGFLAGFISSTAAFADVRVQLQQAGDKIPWSSLGFGMMATAASTLLTVSILFANSIEMIRVMAWSFALVLVSMAVIATLAFLKAKREPGTTQKPQDPLNLKKQLQFALVLFVIIALTKLAAEFIGSSGLLLVSFLSGLFELQGVTFALSATERFSREAVWAMALAYVASLLSKSFFVWTAKGASLRSKGVFTAALAILLAGMIVPLILYMN